MTLSPFVEKVMRYSCEGLLPKEVEENLLSFYDSYKKGVESTGRGISECEAVLCQFLELVKEQKLNPHAFGSYHRSITKPIDYYRFGIDFIRPLVLLEQSKVYGLDEVAEVDTKLKAGHSVVLFANHQTEADPQAISLLLEDSYPALAEKMIFVAGHRVVSDPLAAPFSLGRNLLCIWSKKYVESPAELKQEKVLHNQRTLKKMRQLFDEGGFCIYVAPAGGRDRRNSRGEVEVAPFDPDSIELFWIIGQMAKKPVHFHPLALSTYALMPPPEQQHQGLGEERRMSATPLFLSLGSEIALSAIPKDSDKVKAKALRSQLVRDSVVALYNQF